MSLSEIKWPCFRSLTKYIDLLKIRDFFSWGEGPYLILPREDLIFLDKDKMFFN